MSSKALASMVPLQEVTYRTSVLSLSFLSAYKSTVVDPKETFFAR